MTKSYTYRVIGRGDFPVDMLRYDMAYPADSESASALIFDHLKGEAAYHDFRQTMRIVTLKSLRAPTEARWRSFRWAVVSERMFDGLSNSAVVAAFDRGAL